MIVARGLTKRYGAVSAGIRRVGAVRRAQLPGRHGAAALTRNGMIAMVTMVAFPAIIETGLAFAKIDPALLPFRSAGLFVVSSDPGRWARPVPLLVVAVVLLTATWTSLRRRDA